MAEKVIFEWRASDEGERWGTEDRCRMPGIQLHLSPSYGCAVLVAPGWNSNQMREQLDFFQSMYKDFYENERGDA